MAQVSTPLKTTVAFYMEAANEPLPEGWALANGQTLNSSQQDINPGGNWVTPDLRNRFIIGADATRGVTLLNGAQTLPLATITVDDTTQFPTSGRLNIGTQIVTYTGKTSTTFTGCSGGTGLQADNTLVSYAGQSASHADCNTAAGAPGVQGRGGSHHHLVALVAELPSHSHTQGNRTGTTANENPSHTHSVGAAGSHSHGGVTYGGGGHNHGFPQSMHGSQGSTWFIRGDLETLLYAHTASYNATHDHPIATDNHTHAHSSTATHSHSVSMTGGTTGTAGTSTTPQENRQKFIACVWIIKVKK